MRQFYILLVALLSSVITMADDFTGKITSVATTNNANYVTSSAEDKINWTYDCAVPAEKTQYFYIRVLNDNATGQILSHVKWDAHYTGGYTLAYITDIETPAANITYRLEFYKSRSGSEGNYSYDNLLYSFPVVYDPTIASHSLTLTAKDNANNYWATLSDAMNALVILSSAAEVKKASVANGKLTLTNLDVTQNVTVSSQTSDAYIVPKSTGILIKSNKSSLTYYTIADMPATSISDNMLYPGNESAISYPTPTKDYKYYMLAYGDEALTPSTLGFYYGADDGGVFTSRDGAAYLAVPTQSGAKSGFSFNENPTGINAVFGSQTSNTQYQSANTQAIYSLDGQQRSTLGKGMNIIRNTDGTVKKVMVK